MTESAGSDIPGLVEHLEGIRTWLEGVQEDKRKDLAAMAPASADFEGTREAMQWLADACKTLEDAGGYLRGLADGTYCKSRLRHLTSAQLAEVRGATAQEPAAHGFEGPRWTGAMVIDLVQRQYGVQVSAATISKRRALFGLVSPLDRARQEGRAADEALDAFMLAEAAVQAA